jgi:hypothetical protein
LRLSEVVVLVVEVGIQQERLALTMLLVEEEAVAAL